MPAAPRLPVPKTLKLFIGGKFPRGESGRTLPVPAPGGGAITTHFCRASAKDMRDAVSAARKGAAAWAAAVPYLRGQILYRLAEMLETRAAAFSSELAAVTGDRPSAAARETAASIDRLVHLAGWPDKLSQVFGSVNSVAGPYFNFSTLEPGGVTVLFAPDAPALLASVSLIGSALAAGNACILIAGEKFPAPVLSLAEAIAVSDVPAGAVNILTGLRNELAPCAASHHDVDFIVDSSGTPGLGAVLEAGAAVNMKRVLAWPDAAAEVTPYQLLALTETKTIWHPVGG